MDRIRETLTVKKDGINGGRAESTVRQHGEITLNAILWAVI